MTETLWLRARAPFAAYRWLQAGVYRASAPTMTPSAAWGLLLNLAAIDTRGPLDGPVTQVREDAPSLSVVVGELGSPEVGVLYQQLHSYPVGNSGKELQARTHGSKYWIAPAKREVLIGLDCIIGARGDAEILELIRRGVRGDLQDRRYGLPFAGDNNFFFSHLELLDEPPETRWYVPVVEGDTPKRSARLTVSIDRSDSSRTTTVLYAASSPMPAPPEEAWRSVPGRAPGE